MFVCLFYYFICKTKLTCEEEEGNKKVIRNIGRRGEMMWPPENCIRGASSLEMMMMMISRRESALAGLGLCGCQSQRIAAKGKLRCFSKMLREVILLISPDRTPQARGAGSLELGLEGV